MEELIRRRIDEWLEGPFDEETKAAIVKMEQKNPQALIDAFYTDLSFGTGGLRAVMGVGTNRLNVYTIRKATQGVAQYLLKEIKEKPIKVFIGYDSRHRSKEFALETARVFAGNGIHVFLLNSLRPTPFISYGCREKKCHAAIMITASHNPPQYNGYKVYFTDGAQVVPPHDTGIMKEANAIQSFDEIKLAPVDSSLIIPVDEKLDDDYLSAIHSYQIYPDENRKLGSKLNIVFSSLHGTGITLAPKALMDWGFSSIHYVEEQNTIDGDFPTVKYPNPEYIETLEYGIKHLVSTHSDLLLVTDPDADRLGVVVLHNNKPVILNGNEVASLCCEYLASNLSAKKALPAHSAFVTTIVSTDLISAIAKRYHIACFEVLTGFKYIGEKIHQWEQVPNSYHFLFGAEESYGYLYGTHSRDKDAIISCCLLSEITLWAKNQGKTLVDFLNEIYRKYGIYREKQYSLDFPPDKDSMDKMKSMMVHFRNHPPKMLLEKKVTVKEDYLSGLRVYLDTKKEEKLTLPQSDVILLKLEDETKVIIRPSGTEPKIKIYAGVHMKNFSTIEKGIAECDEKLDAVLKQVKNEVQTG